VNQLMKLVAKINKALPKNTPQKERMVWKKNALRHTYISYRVAECADVARVADESGNSPAVYQGQLSQAGETAPSGGVVQCDACAASSRRGTWSALYRNSAQRAYHCSSTRNLHVNSQGLN
jgi:hypothetical protein